MFIGKDAISGTVELNLTKPENIREVIVTVCAFLVISTLPPPYN